MRRTIYFCLATLFAVLFLLLIAAVKKIDVAAIGPAGTQIGLSGLNAAFHKATGVHMNWYKITNLLGYASLALVGVFALAGLFQLISRRSLLKVDREILFLGLVFIVVLILYVAFEKLAIDYRPVLMDGETAPEAAFPSSHTVLFFVVLGCTALLLPKYVHAGGLCVLLQAVCVILIAVAVGGRLLSGVHWFTDVLGGALLSLALLFVYAGLIEKT